MTTTQKSDLLHLFRDYFASPTVMNQGEIEDYTQFDEKRMAAIPEVKSLIAEFLDRRLSMVDFKEKSERLSRRLPFWGFKNFSGQMQLNQYVNNVEDPRKEELLKDCIRVPQNELEAKKKIDTLHDFLVEQKAASQFPKSIPRVSQQYMLSYFWEIQDYDRWPVYYGSSRKVLLELGFQLDMALSPGNEYVEFLELMRSISALCTSEGIQSKYPFWLIEHALWRSFMEATEQSKSVELVDKGKPKKSEIVVPDSRQLGEWIPNIVTDLVDLSFNRTTPWCTQQNVKPEKAFETKLKYAFTLLGYETEELGQGTGRQPDGMALSMGVSEGDYAIVYDAKARETKFSIGTSDREIYEYVQNKKELLRKKNRIHKLYYAIISSEFDERTAGDALRSLYKRTQVPVTLLRASDLLFIVETKLQNVELDHGRLEDLFIDSGIITREKITDILGIR